MKYCYSFLIIACLFACGKTSNSNNDFDWLVGAWERTNDGEGQQTHEYWDKLNAYEYKGVGVTLMGNDTIFREDIRIIKESDQWFFEVTGVNEGATLFEITSLNTNSFIAENEQNPFPKRIEYQKKEENLNAFVSAKETVLTFNFRPKE